MDETKQPWHKFRDAIAESAKLMLQDGRKALSLLDEPISQAMRDDEPRWVLTLCHHAAIIATFVGDQQLAERYYQQSLAFVPENPAALFGLAEVQRERGELQPSRQYAARCYKAIIEGHDEAMKQGYLDLVIKNWPEVEGK